MINTSDIFVNKVVQKYGQFLSRDEIRDIWIRSGGSKSRLSYAISILTSRDIGFSVARGIYQISEYQPLADYYWKLVAYLMKKLTGGSYVIGGEKSMEMYLKNFSLPDVLILYTRDINARIWIGEGKELHLRTCITGEKSGKLNFYRKVTSDIARVEYEGIYFPVLGIEATLLDAGTLKHHQGGIEESTIIKFLRLYEKKLSRERLGELVSIRYIRSANRLRILAQKAGDEILYGLLLDVIKKEGGGCFITIQDEID